MTPQFEYSTFAHPQDIQQLASILEQCYLMSSDDSEIYINRIGTENFRFIRVEQVIGGLAILAMGQWWGGQRVPMTGIAAVGIAPEYRGSGAAIALMQHTLKELHTQEVPISVLYPATQRLYRKAGYEQGGSLCTWEISTQSIQIREQPLPLQPIIPINHQVFHDLYQQQARLTHGYLDRNQAIWQGLIQPNNQEIIYGYLIGDKDQPQGYIIFSQHSAQDSAILQVRDWVVLSDAAAQTFWSFVANHRSQIKQVRWKSSAIDSLTLRLPEQTAKILHHDRWMLRVIDLVKALEMRGYPPGIQAELHLEVKDDLLAGNNGKFILSVANGCGEVTKGGKGELQLDIKGLAPLYTSLFTPYDLQLAGKLDATETALLAATQIFAGVSPWMINFF
ncbi:GNAT family N-acetyltransferase [Komarekiella sp. 'clone 1']|uniref:GNAT family N-acetyltransferase n=1 Tax=Komarekiella delphini-convector SJRDD-AB1 TaxID=2593771 RepID=A0AA40VQC9_9NOST|nr:GNAT family N-acetyltransferase [Komarekiella delphini-convector]MBD6616154.1 GNAT family N-acetyltransferase [Komarekiella delphini-convector SJRDD-AB1]